MYNASKTRRGVMIATGRTDGESAGAGSRHSAMLVERVNKANTRNMGPVGEVAQIGRASIPIVTEGMRRTGFIAQAKLSD